MIENVMQNARLGGRFFVCSPLLLFHNDNGVIPFVPISNTLFSLPSLASARKKIRALFPVPEKCSYPVYVALFSQIALEDGCYLGARCAALWLEGIGSHADDIAFPSRTSSEQRLVLLPASVTQRESAAKWQPLELASLPPAVEGYLR